MPVFGFNTDVKVGGLVLHVQTEDRGAANPVVDTVIYHKGRVLAKRATSYKEFLASPDFSESELRAMLEQQHQQLLDEVRSGEMPEMKELAAKAQVGGVAIRLMNPSTFLQGTTAMLELVVTRRKERHPVAGAKVRVRVNAGAADPPEFEGATDEQGRVTLQFPLPRFGPGGAELMIQATAAEGQDEVKYSLRPRPKAES